MEKHVTKYPWLLMYAYDKDDKSKGIIYSRHTRYDLAEKAARKSGICSFLKIVYWLDWFDFNK